jgi:hypothetical protein
MRALCASRKIVSLFFALGALKRWLIWSGRAAMIGLSLLVQMPQTVPVASARAPGAL